MKVILIRKHNKTYHAAALLVEPLGSNPEYAAQFLVGERAGSIAEIPEAVAKGTAHAIYDVKIPVVYEMKVIDWIRDQIGCKVSKQRQWSVWSDRKKVEAQEKRKEKKVWTMPELIFVAFNRVGYRLFAGHMPYEMTPSYLSKSPNLFFMDVVEPKQRK